MKNSRSSSKTSSRNQPMSPDKANKDSQTKSTAVATQHQRHAFAAQHEDNTVGAQGCDNANSNDEVDNNLPSVENLKYLISREGTLIRRYQNSKETLAYLKEPAPNRRKSCLSPAQSILDDSIGNSQDQPVILEDDEPDVRCPEVAAVSALVDTGADPAFNMDKTLDQSNSEVWRDVEDSCFVDNNLRPLSLLDQEALSSTITLAQYQPNLRNYSTNSLLVQIGQDGSDRTIRSVSEEPTIHSLLVLVDADNRVGSKEKACKFEMNSNAASEYKKLSPASPNFLNSNPLPSPPADLEYNQSRATSGRSEELKYNDPPQSQDHNKDQPQKRQRGQVLGGAMREDGDDDDDDDDSRSMQGGCDKKQRNQDRAKETVAIHRYEDGVPDTSDEDDRGPRPAKRQKLSICEILTPNVSQISRSPSIATESPPIAEYQEWPFQGFLKRTIIGKETIYNLEFKLPCIHEYPDIPIDPELLRSGTETAERPSIHKCPGIPDDPELLRFGIERAGGLPNTIPHSTIRRAAFCPRKKHIPWYPEEDATILDMKAKGSSWEDIHTALPSIVKAQSKCVIRRN